MNTNFVQGTLMNGASPAGQNSRVMGAFGGGSKILCLADIRGMITPVAAMRLTF